MPSQLPRPAAAQAAAPEGRGFSGAALLVECLIRAGVRTMFGVPGDTGVVLYDALYERATELRHVLARDERHAAAMADAFARATNEVGVVEVSSGGGVTYVIGGLGEAYASSVPVLVITSDIQAASRGTGALTEIDQQSLFAAVTKWRATAESAADIPQLLADALDQATSGRPAPVALILPENVLGEVVPPDVMRRAGATAWSVSVPRARPQADSALVAEAAGILAAAQRPAIVAGSGVHFSQAWEDLEAFAQLSATPVATSIHGKGAISDSSPWSLGVVGANGGRESANAYVSSADAVLFVGTRANATDTNSWTAPARHRVPIVQVDIDSGRAGRNFPGSISLAGDARTVLRQLSAEFTRRDAQPGRAASVRARQCACRAPAAAGKTAPPDPDGTLDPRDVILAAHEMLGPGCTVLAEAGTPTPYVASYWDTERPGRSVIVPRGHGPMGYVIPAAVGAALARPGLPVLAFTADGSFSMACGELETVCRLNLPIIYVQFTNFSLGWIKMLQHLYFQKRYFSVDPGPTDAVLVAQACGLNAARAVSIGHLKSLIAGAAASMTPVYIDVNVRHMIDKVPPVAAWRSAMAGTDGTRPAY
jgi:acetolactate synthase-1/2/3 large subunit